MRLQAVVKRLRPSSAVEVAASTHDLSLHPGLSSQSLLSLSASISHLHFCAHLMLLFLLLLLLNLNWTTAVSPSDIILVPPPLIRPFSSSSSFPPIPHLLPNSQIVSLPPVCPRCFGGIILTDFIDLDRGREKAVCRQCLWFPKGSGRVR